MIPGPDDMETDFAALADRELDLAAAATDKALKALHLNLCAPIVCRCLPVMCRPNRSNSCSIMTGKQTQRLR
jgi:hypothetical protein